MEKRRRAARKKGRIAVDKPEAEARREALVGRIRGGAPGSLPGGE